MLLFFHNKLVLNQVFLWFLRLVPHTFGRAHFLHRLIQGWGWACGWWGWGAGFKGVSALTPTPHMSFLCNC